MKINTNLLALNTQRSLNRNEKTLGTSIERLSSGNRINSAKDDAAGLAIALKFAAQIAGSQQAVRNTNDGISLVQTAEGALNESTANLQRLRELAVQSANGTNNASDRQALQQEFSEIQNEVEQTIESAEFNGQKVLSDAQNIALQVGPNADPATNQTIVSSTNVLADPDVNTALNTSEITTQTASRDAIVEIDAALDKISLERARLGATQNSLSSTVRNLEVSVENSSAAKSRIADTDYAKETSNLARDIILKKAGIAALAHSNINAKLVAGLLNKTI